MKKEKAKIINSVSQLDLCRGFERIYFGDEFCEYKMPSVEDLAVLKNKAHGKKITAVFPYIPQSSFKKIIKPLDFIAKNAQIFDEIVFNDWGFFYYIRENYPDLKLAIGRLLTKQKTDPFARDIILNRQKAASLKHKVFIPKKVPFETLDYFGQNAANSSIFHKFMKKNNIIRVELDALAWKSEIKLPPYIKSSIYYPYAKISTTRYCGQLNMVEKNCLKQCEKNIISLKKYRTKFSYIIKGNAIFFKNEKSAVKNQSDRIVYND